MKNIMLPAPHKILSVTKETQAEYTFRVACDASCGHGQFFQLSIPKVGEAPISVSAKGDGWVEFTIRKVGRLTEGVFGLTPGDTLFMRGPYGNTFPVDEFTGKPLAVIAGGTGLAAVRSMLHYFEANPADFPAVHLIAGFRDIDSVLYAEELARFKQSFSAICTLDNTSAEGFETGFVTAYIGKLPLADGCNVVIVGPPAMMSRAAEECLKNGAREDNIWMAFERKMSCAVGKCGHCKIDETYVCLEGPVFNYTKAKALLDYI